MNSLATTSPSLLKSFLTFRNGKSSPERSDAGEFAVFGSNGLIGQAEVSNAVGPSIIIGRVGSYCGSLHYSAHDTWVTDNAIVCNPINTEESRFWFYALQTLDLNGLSSGSGQPLLNQGILGSVAFTPPSPADRLAIAEVLGALDDKIAVNTKLAASVDEYVRTAFAGLETETVIQIQELFQLRKEPATPSQLLSTTAYVGLEHIPRRSMWIGESGLASDVTSGKSHFQAGDVLFGKLRPYFHKVVSVPHAGICSTDILVLKPRRKDMAGIALAAVAGDAVIEAVTASSEGTRMPRTSWKDLAAVEVPWPTEEVALGLSAKVTGLRESVEAALAENVTLATMRDAILPQLMSGKLRVKDAEKTVEGVS